MLKRVSRRRSPVGRSAIFPGPVSRRPRYFPAITRMCRASPLPCSDHFVALLPFRSEAACHAEKFVGTRGIGGELEGVAASEFEKFGIAQRVGHGKSDVTMLPGAEEFAGSAEFQVMLGDFKTVGGGHHGIDALLALGGNGARSDQDAGGFFGAAANASAELMELG